MTNPFVYGGRIEDPYHFVEDGAAATQNMAVVAQSLGLGSIWIGVYHVGSVKNSAEEKIKAVLKIPKTWRIISILPIGVAKYAPEKERKPLSELVYWGMYSEKC